MDALVSGIRAVIQDRRHVSEAGFRQLASELIESASPLPWILALALSVPIALLVGVPTSGVGIGLLLGLLVGVGLAVHLRVQSRRQAEALTRAIAEARADADGRVGMVARQYEWAVRDAADLRQALRRALAPPIGAEARPDLARRQLGSTDDEAGADLRATGSTVIAQAPETERAPADTGAPIAAAAIRDKRGRIWRREVAPNGREEVGALAS